MYADVYVYVFREQREKENVKVVSGFTVYRITLHYRGERDVQKS